ncbi:Eco57I restriction-modification methylase domain-containing protein [Olivibacter sp. 47]|uniref:type IIG restriction enzyme/methyltransferase n=1 Tax=Olivibacter sp. 47 TaxID=3056486 RepID=UPI0025A3E3A2|nr:Eco57I restriction-modification methylase domain-containing protein [Olivibacter sp. 47]MDM8173662.1 Eco57I restriction-modification methylase domain-containing protein [Olivibacter sp. 47]
MSANQTDFRKALNPAYKKFKPLKKDVDDFVEKLEQCIETIKFIDQKGESEEHLKSPIRKFLEATFYNQHEINTKGRIDLAIYLGRDAKSDIGVVIEAKRPSNKAEFPTNANLNKKALQELLLYYLRERVDHKNNNIKHLIITNGLEWFLFKGEDFYNAFYKNKNLIKEYERFRDRLKDTSKNELFFSEIASPNIETVKNELPYVYIDFRTKDVAKHSSKELVNIYKLFSDVHLMGKSFGNDSNYLNKEFYNELLHIIGLEEVKENSKRIIQRKQNRDRDYGSLMENTIFTLEDRDYLSNVKHIPNDSNKAFTAGLELCLTWVNRILFLKLLESQLLSYNLQTPAYKFLNIDFINGFDELNDLFFSALAKPLGERHARYADKFKHIPYLNSSLFERSYIEQITFDITSLKDEVMDVYAATILKDSNSRRLKGKINTLEYLFKFLDAYDFSAEAGTETDHTHESKRLINASVLGLIFEKINGYKDGSFYTPGVITMFMCRETLRKVVVEKFQALENQQIDDFEDLKSYCARFFKNQDVKRFNEIINSIRVCDPAVGSGHFLVSALNELIAIKSELGILVDEHGHRLPCDIQIENDELYISDAHGDLFEYRRNDPNSLRIQKTIFHEKQTIIENCLFGVDINPNSVNICRLRLWIELLKNAYYTDEGELQTLPNIDINIKHGNSLIHRFSLEDSLKSAFKNKEVSYTIEDYKQAVNDYKKTNSKSKKREIQNIIDTIKSNFKSTLDRKIKEAVQKAMGAYEQESQRQQNLLQFGEKLRQADKDELKKLKSKADKEIKKRNEILDNANFKNAFEWRFEFPEVLDGEGNFVGFDALIGNPPYIQLQKMGTESDVLQKMNYDTYAKTGDIYSLFYEQGLYILRPKGLLTFITSNKWMRAAYGESLRRFLAEKTDPLILIDFGGTQIFDTATVDTNILMFANDKNRQQTETCIIKEKVLNNLSVYFRQHLTIAEFTTNDSWVILSSIERSIKEKIERIGTPLKDWDIQINYGIKTGFNDAFIIDGVKRKELIEQDPKSDEIIRPILRGRDIKKYGYDFADLWLINVHNGIKEKGITPIKIDDYPAIKKHLDNFYPQLAKRTDKGDTPYNLRNCAYMEDFFRQKIVWGNLSLSAAFSATPSGMFLNAPCSIIVPYNAYLLAILNSKLGDWYIRQKGVTRNGGYFEYKPMFVEQLPVRILSAKDQETFSALVSSPTLENRNEIDAAIYELYNLSIEEIKFIESAS